MIACPSCTAVLTPGPGPCPGCLATSRPPQVRRRKARRSVVKAMRRARQANGWHDSPSPDCYGERPRPAEPTDALPGTEGKLAVLEQRAARREQLHHPGDVSFRLLWAFRRLCG